VFLSLAKLSVVEALRATFDADYFGLSPRRIDIEYPQEEEDWPAILVEFGVNGPLNWTGINPDEFTPSDEFEDLEWRSIRRGYFDATVRLMILALSSAERDRLWDEVVELILMGTMHPATQTFHNLINQHDLIAMTLLPSSVTPVGDSIGAAVPWNPDALAYEASVNFSVTGTFHADVFSQRLISLRAIEALPYLHENPTTGEPVPPVGNSMAYVATTAEATAGSFNLTFGGATTAALDYDATGFQLLTALEDLPNVAPGDVQVTGTTVNTMPGLTIIFTGQYAGGDVPALTGATVTPLTGGQLEIAISDESEFGSWTTA
jgi:hypothetical protein